MPLWAHLQLILCSALPGIHKGGKIVFEGRVRGENRENISIRLVIDAAGFSMETWRNLALSYKHLEPVIDRFMPTSRRDNYYCKGLGHVSDEMIRSARTVDELKNRIGNRYHKVNLEAYSRHKTVEFRQHSGTTNFTKMRNWVLFLHKLVTFAMRGQVPAATALRNIPFLDDEQKLY